MPKGRIMKLILDFVPCLVKIKSFKKWIAWPLYPASPITGIWCFVHVRFVFLSEICNNLQVLYLQSTIYLHVYAPIIQKK